MKNTARFLGSVATVLLGIAVLNTPIADADSTDDAFLMALSQQGISFPNLPNQGVANLGHAVCKDWSDGFTLVQTLSDVKGATGLSDSGTGFFVGAATQSYCPQYMSRATG